ncbi:unnamed protein product [Mytilus coruscus]|uniref:WSC domain-containing protein n=1 Tax=Mytilus coruscus TaxID=42192 RepID=A0A6J8AM93_MYTCO|nr:unnamed protein product [Mytilus coruscus]
MDGKREGLDYTYAGCYNRYMKLNVFIDVYKNPRLNMSPFICMRHCQTRLPSNYFGITDGDVCSCIDHHVEYRRLQYILDENGPFKVNDTECDINCFGDTVNKCGGSSTFSIYNILANTTRSSELPSNPVTTSSQRTTVDLNTKNMSSKYEGITENGMQTGIIAGVSVGLTFLLMLAILVVLIRKRSKSNTKRSLQSCSNTNESVRYDNIPQSTQGVNSPYATLTVANDCQTYDDLMPTELTYENTTTMAINYKESTQDKKHKSRRKKRTKR